jgi:putative addiction module component (TIGR02574 family)
MSDLSELTREALALPIGERILLAQELWASLEASKPGNNADDVEQALDLAVQRDAELSSDVVDGVSHAEVMARARKSLECE